MAAKFAYAQWPWGTENKEQFIQSCKDLSEVGFEYFESVKNFINTFKDDISEFKAITEEYNLHPISFYFNFSGNYENDVTELKEKIDFVAANDIQIITVQSVSGKTKLSRDELDYVIKIINTYGDICTHYGIIPCVHPHYNTGIMYENEIDYVMENTNPERIGFAPDTAHLVAGLCDPVKIFDRYKKRIKFTHLKDYKGTVTENDIKAGVDVYDAVRELGEGDINLKEIFNILQGVNYDGYLCAEIDRTRFTHKESAAMNLAYLKNIGNF